MVLWLDGWCPRLHDLAQWARESERVRLHVSRRRGDQGDATNARAEGLRILIGIRHDRHSPHGMSDENDGAAGCDCVDNRCQIATQLINVVGGIRGLLRASVTALVVKDEPG